MCRGRLVRTHPVLGISAPDVFAELQAKIAREMSPARTGAEQ
jgi:hypothetical protein